MNFLVIDDSFAIVKITKRIIENQGFNCREALTGDEALEHCAIELPHYIILDWNMPNMSGSNFMRQFDTSFGKDSSYVLATLVELDHHDVNDALMMGVNDYILKPYSVDRLTEKILTERAA